MASIKQTLMSQKGKMAKRAGYVGLFTLISRITGLLRDTVIAYLLGAREAADAFYIAFRIPNLLRRLLAEGNLTVSFIPIFTQYLKKSDQEAKQVSDITFTFLSLLLLVISILGVIFAEPLVRLTAYGFAPGSEKFLLTVQLTQITFPYIALVSLAALCMGILNARFIFGPPAASSIFLNLGMIGFSLWAVRALHQPAAQMIAWSVMLGGVLQLIVQLPSLIKAGFGFRINFNWQHPGLKKILTLMLPSVLGSAVYQLNIFAITFMASFLPTGSVSYLWYADRVNEFPLGIFAVSLATVALPSFAKLTADNDMDALKKALQDSLNLNWFINLPSTFGLIALAYPIVVLLFLRGGFNEDAAAQTAMALQCFAIGLPFVSANRILVNIFYALQQSKKPVQAAIIAVVVNIGVGYFAMKLWGHRGLALGVSIGSIANFIALWWMLHQQLQSLPVKPLIFSFVKLLIPAVLMLVILLILQQKVILITSLATWGRMLYVMLMIGLGVLVFAVGSWLCKIEEFHLIKNKLFRK